MLTIWDSLVSNVYRNVIRNFVLDVVSNYMPRVEIVRAKRLHFCARAGLSECLDKIAELRFRSIRRVPRASLPASMVKFWKARSIAVCYTNEWAIKHCDAELNSERICP